ncbi:MAG: bromoperoxidase [Pseudomonadota bacterium]
MSIERPFEGVARQQRTKERRHAAANAPHATFTDPLVTPVNGDEQTFKAEALPSSFSKGLCHDGFGFLTGGYDAFVKEINQETADDFSAADPMIDPASFNTTLADGQKPAWRGWESPRTGHYHDLEGADADAIGMAPAPELGSAELVAEMAEVYAMSILRDVAFTEIPKGASADPIDGSDDLTGLGVADVLTALNDIPHFKTNAGADDLFTRRRLAARFHDPAPASADFDIDAPPPSGTITGQNIFRGSGPGAKTGPYVSQLMLIGNGGLGEVTDDILINPCAKTDASPRDGYIAYGNQVIDQRVRIFEPGLDYMTNWEQWLDVQNGADMRGAHRLTAERRFITTPRDLATYVRFDALYQAYLNACLVLLGLGPAVDTQTGFPDQNGTPRTPFASFGGPHVLSLVTEVATRCLKAARRQKFNYHRRARPERISGLLTVGKAVRDGAFAADDPMPTQYGAATSAAVEGMLDQFGPMLDLIAHHSGLRERNNSRPFTSGDNAEWMRARNLLLAMAFPEGSPMHPAYAAGHATVAGGCVTMLKAFFRTFSVDSAGMGVATPWPSVLPPVVPNSDGSRLVPTSAEGLTIEGELNKLAANISIGRNMAGVHYYSDYYDSLRMGERIAVSILQEQLYGYNERVSMVFRSFDGDVITLSTNGGGTVTEALASSKGHEISYRSWWYRHMEQSPADTGCLGTREAAESV